MTIKMAYHRFLTTRRTLHVSLLCALFAATWASAQQVKPSEVEDRINRVKQGKFGLADVEVIAQAHAVEAIPILKRQFDRTKDQDAKAKIAGALSQLGDKEPVYWDFLENRARIAVESRAPYPIRFDAQGKIMPQQFTPDLLQWAKDRNISPGDATQMALYDIPGKVLMLAATGDPRGLSLLREAMSSPNYMIQEVAAKGLAFLQDKESIPLIIGACQLAPADMAAVIAEALIFFDDPQAQSAAATYIPKNTLEALREVKHEPANDPFR
jgi:PBS lyase HEAT-like repeat